MSHESDKFALKWDDFAPSFAQRVMGGPSIRANRAMLSALDAASPLSAATAILDNGSGPGVGVSLLAEDYATTLEPKARIIASDLSPGMIAQVRARKEEEMGKGTPASQLWARVEPAIHDCRDLSSIPSGSLSHVMAGFVMFFLKDPREGLVETLRVLTRGGVFTVSSFGHIEWGDLMMLLNRVRPDKVIPRPPNEWLTVEGVREELEVTGYVDVDVHTTTVYMECDDPYELSRYILLGMPHMALLTKDMEREEIEKVLELMVTTVKEKHPTMPARLEGTAIIGVGRKNKD